MLLIFIGEGHKRVYKWQIIMTALEYINYSVLLNNSNVPLVNNVSFKLDRAQSLGIVGESGSGKSLTALSSLGLLNKKTFSCDGKIFVNERDIFSLDNKALNRLRGNEISMIFKEPMLSLNPVKDLHSQIYECVDLSNDDLDESDIRNSLHAVAFKYK